jgi:two-component system cell cycle sensor histidine kinase/response regulator CckA
MASIAPLLPDIATPDRRMFGRASRPAIARRDRFVLAAVAGAGFLSALALFWALGDGLFAGVFLAAFLAATALAFLVGHLRAAAVPVPAVPEIDDFRLIKAAIDAGGDAVAITDRAGRLVCASACFGDCFPGWPTPPEMPFDPDASGRLLAAGRSAWRDGRASAEGLTGPHGTFDAILVRSGGREDHLVWRFRRAETLDLVARTRALMAGEGGRRLGEAGMMAAVVDGHGGMLAANPVFLARAIGRADTPAEGRDFVDLLATGADDLIRLAVEGEEADPLRLIQIPLEDQAEGGTTLFLMLDEKGTAADSGMRSTSTVHVHALLAMLPLGLALADRDGRFLFMNEAFEHAAGLQPGDAPLYPGDLVVKEDKAAVSDAVRRFAAGQRHSGDLAVRLIHRAEESVALTIGGARGLGDAAVLLSLKDSSEENRLKRQVAQATKMQAVGQLAGGVAHDFNNILTAILGHCDLMLMRHTPGEADYDDIQQIRHNSNRAAGLTRQLLAFSRQQTLRPQVLQLPDVVSETSNLLKRLLNEQVDLIVKHGRNLGPVRADPGQLEQVIVNLAVNARDAMPDGGTLTIQTFAVGADEVRAMASEIMPPADYTALSVSDTGTGIAVDILGKVFEPFFTTKEVGKGTGLGLSTVYGIVKQSGGFIFADSQVGQGTSFVVYLPVHRAELNPEVPLAAAPAALAGELWGSGTILLVEDEDMVRAVAERALARQGYTVLTAANGEEALELLGREPVDLLISDVMMPTMDGPTLVGHARARFPDLPILFMSGYAEETLRRSIDIDQVAFLPKPFSVRQLAEAARDALAERPAQEAVGGS